MKIILCIYEIGSAVLHNGNIWAIYDPTSEWNWIIENYTINQDLCDKWEYYI